MVLGTVACGVTGAVHGLFASIGVGWLFQMLTSGPAGLIAALLIVLLGYRFIKHHIIWVVVLVVLPFILC